MEKKQWLLIVLVVVVGGLIFWHGSKKSGANVISNVAVNQAEPNTPANYDPFKTGMAPVSLLG